MTYFQMSLHVHSNREHVRALPCKTDAFSSAVFMEDMLCPFSLVFGLQERTYHHFFSCQLPS